jgi:hypothetical protein
LRWTAVTALSFLAVYWLTLTEFVGDTQVYVHDILTAHATGKLSPLFEFGHVLWRPLGYVLFRALRWADPSADPRVLVNLALLIPNFIAGLVCAILFFRIAIIVSGSRWFAYVTSLALVCANSFLNYTDSGSSYVAGLALFTASVWLLIREPASPGMLSVAAAACALAGSILLWFPFVTVAPGVLAVVLFWGSGGRNEVLRRMRRGVQLTVITGAVTLACYWLAFRAGGHSSLSELGPWIRDSAHGWHQTANAVRFVFGFPRGFVDLGNDGILFKRYLWHDPYAHVSMSELIRASLLKMSLFYLALAYIIFRLAEERSGRLILIIVAAALLPLLFFAVVLFEPGSPERYLPLFPFAAMAIAFVLSRPGKRAAQVAFGAFLIVSASAMVWSHSVWQQGRRDRQIVEQLQALKVVAKDKSVVWVVLPVDPMMEYAIIRPLDPVNLNRSAQFEYLVESGMEYAGRWREKFSKLTLQAWEQGGTVFVSNQVFASRPERDWNWTEGDIPGVRWTDFPAFFSRLQSEGASSGADGFTEIARTDENRRVMEEISAASASR